MHIVIANGDSDAAYIIDMFNTKENRLTVINGSEAVAQTLMERKHIAVTIGDPWHNAILEAARVYDADIFISRSASAPSQTLRTLNYIKSLASMSLFLRLIFLPSQSRTNPMPNHSSNRFLSTTIRSS